MTTAFATPSPALHQHLVLRAASWRLYDALLDEAGDDALHITYHKGRIEIMPPLAAHEIWKRAIGGMIEMLCVERNIPMRRLGSTTLRSEGVEAGLEPDECYYIDRAGAVIGKEWIDLTVDPPPDLAVEIDITRRSIPRQPVYAALGVPELWRFDGQRLQVLVLTSTGEYEERAASPAFPFLPMDEFRRYLEMTRTTDDTTAMRAFQQWVRTLVPQPAVPPARS